MKFLLFGRQIGNIRMISFLSRPPSSYAPGQFFGFLLELFSWFLVLNRSFFNKKIWKLKKMPRKSKIQNLPPQNFFLLKYLKFLLHFSSFMIIYLFKILILKFTSFRPKSEPIFKKINKINYVEIQFFQNLIFFQKNIFFPNFSFVHKT